jgi:4'-phosphopantetheinyl transferase EntD
MRIIDNDLFPPGLRVAATEVFGPSPLAAMLLQQPADGHIPPPVSAEMAELPALLHPNELAKTLTFTLKKRQREYLSGRLCGKLALRTFWMEGARNIPCPLSEVEIVNTGSGRPMLRDHGLSGCRLPEISITHGGQYAAALIAQFPCGIDLQPQKENLIRVREKYCIPQEEQLLDDFLPDMSALAKLSLLWAAKEAAKKALSTLRMPGFLELILAPPAKVLAQGITFTLAVRTSNNSALPPTVTVLATLFGEYGLALCIL